MAMIRIPEHTADDKLGLEINNGDYTVLKQIVQQWNFKDPESALRFALAVLAKAETDKVLVENLDGEKITIEPVRSLKKTHDDGQEAK